MNTEKKSFLTGRKKKFLITLPLPPKELSPNGRPHWAAKARATKNYREYAWAETTATTDGTSHLWDRAKETARFYFKTNRRRDRDNLLASLKAAFDGITDAQLLINDSGLMHMPVEIYKDVDNPRVEITIEQA